VADVPGRDVPSDPVQQTIDRIRDTVRWLLTGFAAIGAVIITGLSLGNVRGNDTDVELAMLGFGLAIAGIVSAALFAGLVLAGERLLTIDDVATEDVFAELRPKIERSPAVRPYLTDGRGLDALAEDLAKTVRDRADAAETGEQDPSGENKAAFRRLDRRVQELSLAVRSALAEARLYRATRRFRRCGLGMAVSVLVVAVGMFLFVRSLGDPSEPKEAPALLRTPTPVVMVLDDSGRSRLEPVLGAGCVGGKIPAVVLEQRGSDEMRVAVAGSAECHAVIADFELGTDGTLEQIGEATGGP
jgi:hypothetical protein